MGIPVEYQAATLLLFVIAMVIHGAQLLPYMANGEPFHRTFVVGLALLVIRSFVSLVLMVLLVRGALGEFGSDLNSRTVVTAGGLIMGLLFSLPIGEILTGLVTGVPQKGLLWGRGVER